MALNDVNNKNYIVKNNKDSNVIENDLEFKKNNHIERSISKVFERYFVGKDEQADNKAIVLKPGHWA